MDNCIFVNSLYQNKDSVPVNITAWDKNATFIAENFEKGEKINIVGLERLHRMKIGEKTFGICSFTVIKIIDWKIYIAITAMLQVRSKGYSATPVNTSGKENCWDIEKIWMTVDNKTSIKDNRDNAVETNKEVVEED